MILMRAKFPLNLFCFQPPSFNQEKDLPLDLSMLMIKIESVSDGCSSVMLIDHIKSFPLMPGHHPWCLLFFRDVMF